MTIASSPSGMQNAVQIATGQWVDIGNPSAAGTAADPYVGKYVTAGDPYVTADGIRFNDQDATTQQSYIAAYGTQTGPMVWAEARNLQLLQSGQAVQTAHGVMTLDNAKFAVNKAGFNGPQDVSSIASAYQLLATPPTPPPTPAPVGTVGAITGGLHSIQNLPKPLVYAGLALVAYEMFFKRGHR